MNAGIHYLTFTLTFLIQNVSTGQEPFLCTGQGFLTMNVDGRSTLVELRIDPYDGVLHFDTSFCEWASSMFSRSICRFVARVLNRSRGNAVAS